MLTLHYIQDKSHRFKIYVANRATQILESTSAADRNFSEGVENPADISLRGGGGGGVNQNLLCNTDTHRRNRLARPTFLY